MALTGTITVTTSGNAVSFGAAASTSNSANTNFRARSVYVFNLTVGNSVYLDVTTTSAVTTGYTIPPSTQVQFPILNGTPGFSAIASTAAGSLTLSYLASR